MKQFRTFWLFDTSKRVKKVFIIALPYLNHVPLCQARPQANRSAA